MKAVTTSVRAPSAARILAGASLVTCIAALILDSDEIILAAGLAFGVAFAVAALLAYLLAPKRTVVLLDVRDDRLHVTSRTDPLRIEIGRPYRKSIDLPIDSVRKLVLREVNLSRFGEFVDVTVTTRDDTTQRLFFPWDLRDDIRAFFARLQNAWPNLEFVDDGYHNRITWRSWQDILGLPERQEHGRR